MTIRDIAVAFGFEVDRRSEKQAEGSIKGIKNMATKLLGAIGIGFSIAGLGNLAQAAADVEALESQFSQVFGDIETEASSVLGTIADNTGVAVNRMKGSFVQIAAFAKTTGMDTANALALSDRSMQAVADSAAFYDRSLEEVTDSLQSFLKGNFEQDASLGLACTEVTRNTAANVLYGKSFKDLAEDQKQLTLLKMVEDANQLSGAYGQAARESDTWTNQLGNLKQNLQDLKAVAGSTFLKPAIAVLKLLSNLTKAATEKLQELTGEGGALTNAFDRMHAIVKRLKPSVDRMMQTLSNGAAKSIGFVKGVVDKLGGIGNILKVLSIAAAAFFAVMGVAKIMSLIKAAGGMVAILSKLSKIFSVANLKILAIVAVIVILALIIEDFINFMMGNDSIIGSFFDKAGIGADNARQTIINAWGIIKTFLKGVWTFISQLAATLFGNTEDSIDSSASNTKDNLLEVWGAILDALSAIWDALYEVGSAIFNAIATVIETVFGWIQTFWDAWGSRILSWFKTLWDSIGGILNGFLDIIKGVANFISSVFTGDWQGAWDAIKQIFTGIWEVIVNFITAVWDTIKMLFEMALSAISSIWNAVWGAISSFFQGIWNGIVSFIGGIWNSIVSTISNAINSAYNTVVSVLEAIWTYWSNIFTNIASFVSNIFSNILSGIGATIGNIKDTIVNGINAAVDFIKGLPSQAIQWGKDFINGLKDGILSGVQGIIDAVKGIGEKIKSFLHFSVPDEGPLTEYESWMPDFMSGLAKGISSNEDTVLDKVKGLASGIATLTQAATAKAATATTGTVNNASSSVTQNVNIDNSYSGGSTETQQNVSKAMKKSATDATTQMARALAYSRG